MKQRAQTSDKAASSGGSVTNKINLRDVRRIAHDYNDGLEHDAQFRFQKMLRHHGPVPLMEAIAASDLPNDEKVMAAKFALQEKGNDVLNSIIHTLGFVPEGQHGKLANEAEPIALYLSALQRREKAFNHMLPHGQTAAEISARVEKERSNLIPEIVRTEPTLGVLFPNYTPPVKEAFQAATPEVVKQIVATPVVVAPPIAPAPSPVAAPPAPVKQLPISENGVMPPPVAASIAVPPTPPEIKIYPDAAALYDAVCNIIKKQQPRSRRERDADMMEAVALIDANAAHGITSNHVRSSKGDALFKAELFEDARVYLESVLQKYGREHAHDSYPHVLYVKTLCKLGRAADGEKHLTQRVGPQGLLRNNAHVQNAFALCLRETKGTQAALAHYDTLPKSYGARFDNIAQMGRETVQRMPTIAPPKASTRLRALVAKGEANYDNALVHHELVIALRNEGTPELADEHLETIFGPCGRFAGNDHAAKAFGFPPAVKVERPALPPRKGPLFTEAII